MWGRGGQGGLIYWMALCLHTQEQQQQQQLLVRPCALHAMPNQRSAPLVGVMVGGGRLGVDAPQLAAPSPELAWHRQQILELLNKAMR